MSNVIYVRKFSQKLESGLLCTDSSASTLHLFWLQRQLLNIAGEPDIYSLLLQFLFVGSVTSLWPLMLPCSYRSICLWSVLIKKTFLSLFFFDLKNPIVIKFYIPYQLISCSAFTTFHSPIFMHSFQHYSFDRFVATSMYRDIFFRDANTIAIMQS